MPENWRIIGTMNTFDKASLYQLSFAFMRRFAFVDVDPPEQVAYAALLASKVRRWPSPATMSGRCSPARPRRSVRPQWRNVRRWGTSSRTAC